MSADVRYHGPQMQCCAAFVGYRCRTEQQVKIHLLDDKGVGKWIQEISVLSIPLMGTSDTRIIR